MNAYDKYARCKLIDEIYTVHQFVWDYGIDYMDAGDRRELMELLEKLVVPLEKTVEEV